MTALGNSARPWTVGLIQLQGPVPLDEALAQALEEGEDAADEEGEVACVCGVVFVLVFVFVRSLSARRAWEFRDSTGPPGGRARAFCLLSAHT
jgi:hypothetical protein